MEYTKQDLVDFIYYNSKVTKKVLQGADIEDLEAVIDRWNVWERFYNEYPTYRRLREQNRKWNEFYRRITA